MCSPNNALEGHQANSACNHVLVAFPPFESQDSADDDLFLCRMHLESDPDETLPSKITIQTFAIESRTNN